MNRLRASVEQRGVTRLCHFTPARNLAHILADQIGVLASHRLEADERAVFNPTDLERLDGHRGHICCSIEYPNSWYFEKARTKERLFPHWVVLLLSPELLLLPDTKFCARNAAAAGGALIGSGLKGFDAMYAEAVAGARGRVYRRSATRPEAVPTDDQAEVLIPDVIPLSKLLAVAVRDRGQALLEQERLRQLNLRVPRLVVAPMFYDAGRLSTLVAAGQRPEEELFCESE